MPMQLHRKLLHILLKNISKSLTPINCKGKKVDLIHYLLFSACCY